MYPHLKWTLILGAFLALAGCSSSTPPPPTPTMLALTPIPTLGPSTPVPTLPPPAEASADDPFFASDGGGEPRTGGYWKLWSSCTEGNQAAVAASNGGREAGWIILDDVLEDPGVLVGELSVEICDQAVNVIDRADAIGGIKADDAAYALASELLVTQVNLAIGTEYCPAVEQAVRAGQLLLISLSYDGTGDYLGPGAASDDGEVAWFLTDQLAAYNAGTLCQ